MADISLPARECVAAQRVMFDRADHEHGLSLRALAARSPVPFSTLKGWRDGAAMPACAIGALGDAGVPDELLSLVLAPFGRFVVTDTDDDGDLDTAAQDATAFAGEVLKARGPNSPGGLAIVPQERSAIEPLRRRAASSLRRAA
jgi:hypothetical protein